MRTLGRILLAGGGAALAAMAPGAAFAQNDVTPHLPNVLLVLDTSGSMEYLLPEGAGGAELLPESGNPLAAGAACANGAGGVTTQMNRWATLVSVLTGSFPGNTFGCETVYRNTANFATEYGIAPYKPYDYDYFLPWHRIYVNGCTLGAGTVAAGQDWSNWGPGPLIPHKQTGLCPGGVGPNCCIFTGQNNDGILDVFAGLARFGLMTMDSMPDPGTGSVGGTTTVDPKSALWGNWSYFHNWRSYGYPPASPPPTLGDPAQPTPRSGPAAGQPDQCTNGGNYLEVGARNPAAPPWEGPLAPFGPWCTDNFVAQNNQNIQNEILSMRPYGATPLAALLDDARELLFYDKDQIPNTSYDFGAYSDGYWSGGCRKTYIIILTDGEPNSDMRGKGKCDVAGGTGICPYDRAEDILTSLRMTPPGNGNQKVITYVVGFALSNPGALTTNFPSYTSCSQLKPADCASGPGGGPPAGLEDCCELQKLAVAGANNNDPVFTPSTTPYAFFANNAAQLKSALASILSGIVGTHTARTAPVYTAAGDPQAQGANLAPPGGNPALSYHFAASLYITSSAGTSGQWTGELQRERYACVSGVPTAQPITKSLGDDYAANLDSGAGNARQFLTAIGDVIPGQPGIVNSDYTIRPNVQAPGDGFGVYLTQTTTPAAAPTWTGANFMAAMNNIPGAFGIQPSGNDTNCINDFGLYNQPGTCAQYLVNWAIGGTNPLTGSFSPAVSRDPTSPYCTQANTQRQCSRLGAIYHSTPVIVGPPREFLNDDTYTTYASGPYPGYTGGLQPSTEPIVLYTATIDGQLHAFKVSSSVSTDTPTTDVLGNNELWSFFPPAVLQHLDNNFNSGGANLLDGTPVIADIPGAPPVSGVPVFERTPSSTVQWHRVLVGGSGYASAGAGGYYYALDITDPNSPSFLWQISTDGSGHRLFGNTTPTPAITSVAIMKGLVRTQVPVAILPGGSGTWTACAPGFKPPSPPQTNIVLNDGNNPSNPNGAPFNITAFNAPNLNCWAYGTRIDPTCSGACNAVKDGAIVGASITIVRLDTGQILAHFLGQDGHGSTVQQLGSPPNVFTGMPFTAPMTGAPVVYPSDTGQVAQKVYIGDADGQLWRIDLTQTDPKLWTASLEWDAYLDSNLSVREAIELAPVLSRDPIGNTTIIFATGEQNMLTASATDNRFWSITETPALGQVSQNWVYKFAQAQGHVVGQMALFNDVLYFSTYEPLGGNPTGQGDHNPAPGCNILSGVNPCNNGQANLGAADYRRPADSTGVPVGRWGTTTSIFPPAGSAASDGSVIYGVSATELPSCGTTNGSNDAYFGSHSQVVGANAAEYRIMWQTGSGSGVSGASGARAEGGISGMQNMTIPPPGQSTRVDSWGTIVE